MLADFQQALADLAASPELCRGVRRNPEFLRARYSLTDKEFARLTAMANHKGMECVCMLYRANRLAPFAINLPRLCRALGDGLREVLSAYWAKYPKADAHFLLESRRFCDYVRTQVVYGRILDETVASALSEESNLINLRLEASRSSRPAA